MLCLDQPKLETLSEGDIHQFALSDVPRRYEVSGFLKVGQTDEDGLVFISASQDHQPVGRDILRRLCAEGNHDLPPFQWGSAPFGFINGWGILWVERRALRARSKPIGWGVCSNGCSQNRCNR